MFKNLKGITLSRTSFYGYQSPIPAMRKNKICCFWAAAYMMSSCSTDSEPPTSPIQHKGKQIIIIHTCLSQLRNSSSG